MPTNDNNSPETTPSTKLNQKMPDFIAQGTVVDMIDNSYVSPSMTSQKAVAVIGVPTAQSTADCSGFPGFGVPTLITSWVDYVAKFGEKHSDLYAPYYVENILANGSNVLFTAIEGTPNSVESPASAIWKVRENETYGLKQIQFHAFNDVNANKFYMTFSLNSLTAPTKLQLRLFQEVVDGNDIEITNFATQPIEINITTIDGEKGFTLYNLMSALLTDINAEAYTDDGTGNMIPNPVYKQIDPNFIKSEFVDLVLKIGSYVPTSNLISEDPKNYTIVLDYNASDSEYMNYPSIGFDGASLRFTNISEQNMLYGHDLGMGFNQYAEAITEILNHYDYDFSTIFIPGLNFIHHKNFIDGTISMIKSEYFGNAMLIADYAPVTEDWQTSHGVSFNFDGRTPIEDLQSPIDVPFSLSEANQSKFACYYPSIIKNNEEGIKQLYPITMYVCGLYSNVESIGVPWQVISGMNKGVLEGNVKLSRKLNKRQVGALYKANINPVISYVTKTAKPIVWGQKTAMPDGSSLSRINVSKLAIYLQKTFLSVGDSFAFEYNDSITRTALSKQLSSILDDVKFNRGLYDFKVKCDSENNTPTIIDRNQLIAEVWFKPSRTAEFIYIPVTIEKTETNL